jgi:hypothetical protein
MEVLRIMLTLGLTLLGCTENELVVHDGTDVFYQSPPQEVDILLVVDDSCSMQPYQQKLSKNFSEFITFFDEANILWHIGVTTTDIKGDNAGQLANAFITWEDADAQERFEDAVNVGIDGYYHEAGLHAAWMALENPNNQAFLRPDASLSLIFVSDEEDVSPWPVHEYTNRFYSKKGGTTRDAVNASAVVVTDVSTCENQSRTGDRYLEMAEQTNGVIGNICEDNFADIVTELSLNASRLMDTFELSGMPNPATLAVSVESEELDCAEGHFTYDVIQNEEGEDVAIIVFDIDSLPQPSQQIAIRYYDGDGNPESFCEGADATSDDTGGGQ